ncbi:MAG: DHHW family protein [Firmicutes bacterium]|nr:DHHW family protein [Bacillota bacterium]
MLRKIAALLLLLAVLTACGCSAGQASSQPESSQSVSSQAASSQSVSSQTVSSQTVSSQAASSQSASSQAVSSQTVSSQAASSQAASSGTAASFPEVAETVAGGHYHNNIQAQYSGNVLICGDYALEYFSLPTAGNASYAAMVNAFAEKYPALNVSCALVPKSCAFHAPSGYADCSANQQNYIANTYAKLNASVKRVDAFGTMAAHRDEYLYYRTDHHWTSLGAYYASAAYCSANGIVPRGIESYTTVINRGYLGSLYSFSTTSLKEKLRQNLDYTVGHLPQTAYTMTYQNGGKTYTGTAINQNSNSYAGMFLCGDQPFTDIVTANKNGRRLMVFKESYGNAFVPYMIDYYEEIIVVDIRSDKQSVAALIPQYGITDVLILNNVQASVSLAKTLQARLNS